MTTSPMEYWGAMIEPQTKGPSLRLKQLLLGIAHYVVKNVEPRDHHVLTPTKLAAFYRAVGGDFDELFISTPPASLSFIYSALGCYHSLQPSEDPYAPPSIPALTAVGFVRWETIQLLLEPDEHAAFLQEAVRKYSIPNKAEGGVHGSIFPPNLPRECFPRQPDESMCRWHEETLQELKRDLETGQTTNRPKMQSQYSSTTARDDMSSESEDGAAGAAGGGYFVSRLKDKLQQRLARKDSRPTSKDSRDSRERRYKYREDVNGERDQMRKRRSPDGGRPTQFYSPSSDEASRRTRGHRAYTSSSYESPGSPGSPLSPTQAGPSRSRRGERPYSYRDNRDRNRERERDRDPEVGMPPPPPQSGARLQRPTQDPYVRRHSAHYPHTTLSPDDEPPRARSRSHDRSPTQMSPGRFAAGQAQRPTPGYFPQQTPAGGAAPPSSFARGKMRHTVHSPTGSPYRGRQRDSGGYEKDPGRNLEEGWRYIPADRAHIR